MNWPWTKKTAPPGVDERLEALEKQLETVLVEWEEWYDKYRSLYARIARRVSRLDALEAAQDAPETPILPHSVSRGGVDRTAQLNAAILSRRGHHAVPNGQG